MQKAPVYIVDIIGEVVAATDAALFADGATNAVKTAGKHINYVYGAESHVTQRLLEIGSSKTGANKYPMVALMMPVTTRRGNANGYYGDAFLPVIYIATLSDNIKLPPVKYRDNFKPVLFPIYEEVLNQLAKHPRIVNVGGADAIAHNLVEYPADITSKANTIFTDFLDILAITNLSFPIQQQFLRNCAVQRQTN